MKKITLALFAIFSFLGSYGQKPILVFDLMNGTIDSIPIQAYDTTTLSDQTNYFIGSLNNNSAVLEQTAPLLNTYPNSNFTYKKVASRDFDLTKYPIRTTVKLFSEENAVLSDLCTGSLISKRHILTAAHCVANFNANSLRIDSIKASPVFDNGLYNGQFSSSYVSKVYIFRDWRIGSDDFAILELEEDLGASSGWISIGFNKIDSLLLDGIFYKFTYPAITDLAIDSNEYNGDTLYYNYGIANVSTQSLIGIRNVSGIPGESGSSLIKVVNQQEYTSYGVLSFALNLNHSRIADWQYYAIKNIIQKDLLSIKQADDINNAISVYPNPINSFLRFEILPTDEIFELKLFDSMGKLIKIIDQNAMRNGIDLSYLPNGFYYLRASSALYTNAIKLVKE